MLRQLMAMVWIPGDLAIEQFNENKRNLQRLHGNQNFHSFHQFPTNNLELVI